MSETLRIHDHAISLMPERFKGKHTEFCLCKKDYKSRAVCYKSNDVLTTIKLGLHGYVFVKLKMSEGMIDPPALLDIAIDANTIYQMWQIAWKTGIDEVIK